LNTCKWVIRIRELSSNDVVSRFVLLDEIHAFEDSQNSAGYFFYAAQEFLIFWIVRRVESHGKFVTRHFPSALDVEHVEMDVKVDMSSESLDEGDSASFEVSYFVVWVFFIEPLLHRFFDGFCDDGVSEPEYFPLEFGIACAHVAQGHWHREDPLANDGADGEYVVSEVCSGFGHSPCPATSAKSSFFATEGDEALVLAIYAAEAQESVRQHAALEEGLEFFSYM
jgi:hypothetical protein